MTELPPLAKKGAPPAKLAGTTQENYQRASRESWTMPLSKETAVLGTLCRE
jgi:hypothetical protein